MSTSSWWPESMVTDLFPLNEVQDKKAEDNKAESGASYDGVNSQLVEYSPGYLDSDKKLNKKRLLDRAYRHRKKQQLSQTMMELDLLRDENSKLKSEIQSLKSEGLRMKQTLKSQKEEMKQLQQSFSRLKVDHDRQAAILKLLSKQLTGSNSADLQSENTKLQHKITFLMNQINNSEMSDDMLKIREKNDELENEKRVLKVIVEALCEKINNYKGHKQEQA